jgi:hypothetical protein
LLPLNQKKFLENSQGASLIIGQESKQDASNTLQGTSKANIAENL